MNKDIELQVKYVRTDELLPYYGNAKKHPRKQVEQIAKSIKEFGNCDPLAIWTNEKGDYEIVEGHGRLMALDMLGIKEAPVIFLDHLSDEQRRQYTHVHNQLTMNSGWDEDILSDDMLAMPDFDWEAFGFDLGDDEDETYTKKVDSPIYEITGECPDISELCDLDKANSLREMIAASNVSDAEKLFLEYAAMRHVVFSYSKIAEYYAHASDEMQNLMEDSALVIIDYDKAIEMGYVKLRDSMEAMI